MKEKEKLLQALYKYGHLDIEKIQSEIPLRSQGSIRSAISQWKKEARTILNKKTRIACRFVDEEVLKEVKTPMLLNTEKWTELFKHMLQDKSNIQYGLSKVFLIIAEIGDFPPPELCDGVNFR